MIGNEEIWVYNMERNSDFNPMDVYMGDKIDYEYLPKRIMKKETQLQILESLADAFKTDKKEHGYLPFYVEYMPEVVRDYLEIGIARGGSLQMFNSYFDGKTDIHCIDLFLDPNHVTQRWCREHFFVPYQCSQTDIARLSTIKHEFDVVSEDASHNCYDQIVTFKHIFVNNLRASGVYFLEDTHTSQPKEKFYWGNGVEEFEYTPLWLFKNFVETGKIKSKFFNEGESAMFENIIESVHVCAEDKLIVIKKK